MQQIDVLKRTVGVNFSDEGEAVINVWSPLAEEVVVITPNGEIALAKSDYGYWSATTGKLKEGDRYKIKKTAISLFPIRLLSLNQTACTAIQRPWT